MKTETLFKHHILPAFGSYRISKITIDICQNQMDKWVSYYKNYNKLKSYTSRVFRFAISRDLIDKDPFEYVIVPHKRKEFNIKGIEEENFYTKDELIKFLKVTQETEKQMIYTFFYLLSYTGMRKGEVLALTWSDINFDNQTIEVSKALAQGKNNRLYVKPPKTGDMRTVSIDTSLSLVLIRWKQKQSDINQKKGFDVTSDSQLVFANEKNDYLQLSKTNTWIKRIQRKNKLKEITTHGLRHTHCTLLFEAGASLQEVQNRLGHSDVQTTINIYTHITEKTQKNAMNAFSNYLNDNK